MSASTLAYSSHLVSVAGGTFLGLMDAIHTGFSTLTTKWGVNSTVGGAGAREVVEVAPVGGTFPNQRVALAGKSAGAPLMQSPDTFLANALLVGCSGPEGGTFVGASWATATPNLYGAARQIPFSRASGAVTTFTGIQILESDDDFWLIIATSTPSWYGVRAGCWMRVDIAAESESSSFCLHGYQTSGSAVIATGWATVDNGWMGHGTTAGQGHSYVFQPGSSTVWPVLFSAMPNGTIVDTTPLGNRRYKPIYYKRQAASEELGTARETFYALGQYRTRAADGTGNQFEIFGPSSSSNVNAVALAI